MSAIQLLIALLGINNVVSVLGSAEAEVGVGEWRVAPSFSQEPSDSIAFTNETGGSVQCVASGHPPPTVHWTRQGLASLADPSSSHLYHTFHNGTLLFNPFRAEEFRADVLRTTYRCVASNAAGTIVSRSVHVTAVVVQSFVIEVHDVTVLHGNAAIFQCHVPTAVRDFVTVTSWLRDDEMVIERSNPNEDTKHLILPSGELFIKDVHQNENGSWFRCQIAHSLTGESRTSNTSGRLVVTSTEGVGVAPKIVFSKAEVVANELEDVVIPCVADGNPPPEVMWFARLNDGLLFPIHFGGRMEQLGSGLLIKRAQASDSGAYVCDVKNGYGNARGETAAVIQEPILVTVQPANQTVEMGSVAVFRCLVTGHPFPTVRWLKDGLFLPANLYAGEELTLTSVKWTDAGIYQCLAESGHRSAQAQAQLLLGDIAPELQEVFTEQAFQPGVNVTLVCSAIGSPSPVVEWFLDDVALDVGDERYSVDEYVTPEGATFSTLFIGDVRIEDGGVYRCGASNKVGRVEHSSRVNVYGPISVRQMASVSAVTGQTIIIHCPVYGYPIDSIQWWKEGDQLPQDLRQSIYPNGTLMVSDVSRTTDAGRYTCVAANNQGDRQQQHVDVNILIPPKLVPFSFKDQLLREGVRARLQCVVTEGDSPLTLQWFKDGRLIPPTLSTTTSYDAIAVRAIDAFSSVLNIKSVSPQHNGNYTCLATNMAASVSHSTRLFINVAPKILPFSFQGGHLFEGVLARVACVIYQGDLPLKISWTKDGRPIPAMAGISISEFDEYSSILTISDVTPVHSGNYTCTAQNHAASAVHTAELIVNVPPRWKLKPEDLTVVVGDDAVIHCVADGFPQPFISWMWSNEVSPGAVKKLIHSDDVYHVMLNGSLSISRANRQQQGYYFCQASNKVGPPISAVSYLAIKFPAKLSVWQSNLTIHHGRQFTLECKAGGDFPINFTWTKDGVALPSDNDRYAMREVVVNGGMTSELNVIAAMADDSTVFDCYVENAYGRDIGHYSVTVQQRPEAPSSISVDELSSRSVNLSWTEPFDGHSAIIGYTLEYKRAATPTSDEVSDDVWLLDDGHAKVIMDSVDSQIAIAELLPATHYYLRLFAKNDVGISQPSPAIVVKTDEEAPSGPPRTVKATAINSKTLKVCWQSPGNASLNGALKGYYLGHRVWASTEPPNYKQVTNISSETCANVTGLKKFVRYSVTVQAFNDVGRGPDSEELMAMTAEGVPTESAANVTCSPLSSKSILVMWQPAPLDRLNGILRGYKVMVYQGNGIIDGNYSDIRNTTAHEIIIDNLSIFSRYSFRISGFTGAGDGTPTEPIGCRTKEDVPGVPAAIRAVVMTPDTVLVTWKAPVNSNGELVQFNVHMKEEWSKPKTSIHWSVPADVHQYEVPNLKENQKYSFWVTASTSAGDGEPTKIVTLIPKGPQVPAQMVSFDEVIEGVWRQRVLLPCRMVGIPAPDRKWLYGDGPVKFSPSVKVFSDGILMIKEAQGHHSGNYTCAVRNSLAKDRVRYSLRIKAPPEPPTVINNFTSRSSIGLNWLNGADYGAEIKGFILQFREVGGNWELIDLDAETLFYELTDLQCGTSYEVTVTAINEIGKGKASEVVKVTTNGSLAELSKDGSSIEEGPTSLTIHLEKLVKCECPIEWMAIEYRSKFSDKWISSEELKTNVAKMMAISGLMPASWYKLRLKAKSSAGTATADYEVATLGLHGGTVTPDMETPVVEDGRSILFYIDLRIVIPIAACIGLLLLALVVMCVCVEKKKDVTQQSPRKSQKSETCNNSHLARRPKNSDSANDSFRQSNLDAKYHKNYSSSTTSSSQQARPSNEDLAPYATYHLNNATEMQTFQQRTTGLNEQTPNTDNEEEQLERVKMQVLQQLSRPKSYTPGYANVLAESPSTAKRKLRQVAIPTAPNIPASPSRHPGSAAPSQMGSQTSGSALSALHLNHEACTIAVVGTPYGIENIASYGIKVLPTGGSRPATPTVSYSNCPSPAVRPKPLLINNDIRDHNTMSSFNNPNEMMRSMEVNSLPLPPRASADISPVYSNVADADFLNRRRASSDMSSC